MNKIYILDTNIILDNTDNLYRIYDDSNKVIIPFTVLEELDAKKSGFGDINYQAREFARLLSTMSVTERKSSNNSQIIKLKSNDLELELFYYDTDNTLNDDKIIDAWFNYPSNERKVFLTMDTFCKYKAISRGVDVEDFGSKQNNLEFNFVKYLNITDDLPENGTEIKTIDPDYTLENFSYVISNNIKTKLYIIENNRLFEISDDIEKQDIKPIGIGQKLFVAGVLNETKDIIVANALAGSGKTLISISTALKLIKAKKYNKIVYIRNSIESLDKGEDIGYLPGLEEKFAVYNHPLYDCINIIAKTQLEKSNKNKSVKHVISEQSILEKSKEIQEKACIETMWVGELRGRTISDAVVIVDECQNISSKQLQLILTRIDKSCKVIVIGSNNQIDNIYTNKYSNGLTTLLNACKTSHPEVNLFATNLTKCLRGPISEFAERVFG